MYVDLSYVFSWMFQQQIVSHTSHIGSRLKARVLLESLVIITSVQSQSSFGPFSHITILANPLLSLFMNISSRLVADEANGGRNY